MPEPLLYTYRRCPYAMRARMALLQAGRSFRAHEIELRQKPAAFLVLSSKGTVPVLQLPDGQLLEESWDVMRWAFEPDDRDGWWQRAQTAENLGLLHRSDGDFKYHLDRYKYPERYGQEVGSREVHRARAMASFLMPLEEALRHHPFLGGSTACATDLAIFPFVRQFSLVEPRWFSAQPLSALQAWLACWLDTRLFSACMVKLPTDTVVAFPALPD